jgi:toxin-antitoxin system PIN domain toxin
MTSNATSALFDVNLWLALSYSHHLHHTQVLAALPTLPPACFCRFTQSALFRLLTNPQVMGPGVHTPASAWQEYDNMILATSALFLDEPKGLEAQWRHYANQGQGASGSAWTDAYLATFAKCAGLQLVTFDRGFKRFAGLNCRVL